MSDDPPSSFQPVKRRVKGPLLDPEDIAGNLLNSLGNRPTVLRLKLHGFKDEEIECALGRSICWSAMLPCRFYSVASFL